MTSQQDLSVLKPKEPVQNCLGTSVVDPNLKGSTLFCRIGIRIIGSDPEPKGFECKFYVLKLEFL